MASQTVVIERIGKGASADDVRGLATLLLDAVDSNAGISFLADLTQKEAEDWWRSVLESSSPRAVILIARGSDGIVGTVQMQPAWAPNQPHRADIAKLIVHRRAHRRGIARALMAAIEREARAAGFTLLLLDTCMGGAAEQLYTSSGWVRVGAVPGFALNPDGSECETVFYYKPLA